ncbi:MAG TPA: BMP family ABC transporter substrate-binding protein, partial [Kofleriaceae bacterium]|jgi:basic membrane protein A|nr:BMP family ABC transporter substrate-binding protein [Kofleriaceae bacterium]
VRLIAILIAANVLLVAIGLVAFPTIDERVGKGVRVGLVFDLGGKDDKSFNTAAWNGLEAARDQLGVHIEYIEPSEGNDRATALRSLAAKHVDLVIGVGVIVGPDLEQLAREFPDVNFAGIDYAPGPNAPKLPNLLALKFREQEGSFLVGAIAALVSRTHTIGFVGGMKLPLIRKFEVGYTAGAHHVCPTCRVLAVYAGTEPKAFNDAPRGQELGAALYDEGADIIFTAAGKTGDGVFAVARSRGLYAIGVDSDQYDMAPCCIVTSMLKRGDLAVLDAIRDVVEHHFHGGVRDLGLAEKGVGFVADERNRRLLPLDVVGRVNKLADQIVAGTIQVPFE